MYSYSLVSIFKVTEAVVRMYSVKKLFLEISKKPQENTCAGIFFKIKLQVSDFKFIKKELLAQVFSCEFCEISKNTFFYRIPLIGKKPNHLITCTRQ